MSGPPDNRPPSQPSTPPPPKPPSSPRPKGSLSPAEYGRWLAEQAPPISGEVVEEAGRILAAVAREKQMAVAA